MSSHEVPPFDLLTNQPSAFEGFGTAITARGATVRCLRTAMEKSRRRLEDGFARRIPKRETSRILDSIIQEMWSEGWDPKSSDVNLFATDFGLVLTEEVLLRFGGNITVRSPEDPSHLSLYWPANGVEAFPFHKVLKCLMRRKGESVQQFVDGLQKYLPSPQRGE